MKISAFLGAAMATNKIYNAHDFMNKSIEIQDGILYDVKADDGTELQVVHLYGDAYERGVAQGRILGDQIYDFVFDGINNYARGEILDIDFPKWVPQSVQDLLTKAILEPVADYAVALFERGLTFVYHAEKPFITKSLANNFTEIKGIVDGMCENPDPKYADKCATGEMEARLLKVNMVPDLS